ncbi:hypothetical protein C1I95_19200 [Micromonospora craterilacus]|uniref:Uncharacterized protein n=1 Tax=Micromonospora craterilacus TaxID=1655439 RepID=A0A2W2DZV0_9ACTN|nr:hypothetical protein [Micromonospora craterilacus]PZG15601.1 hypothetical protein C1I95_19200 [Micromonospora craterilacus]
MTLHQIRVYHNVQVPFMKYENGHKLMLVVSHWRELPAATSPVEVAAMVWRVCNADLDYLQRRRAGTDGEADFLLGCVYRLLRLRSLSVGDVVEVVASGCRTWLACDATGWRRVDSPANLSGQRPMAEAVYQHIANTPHRP